MNSKILIVGFACLSAVALAQSDASQQKSATSNSTSSSQQVSAPRDVATGQTSGKRMHKPITVNAQDTNAPETMVRESPSKASLGRTNASVAAGDVNRDGTADLTATKPASSNQTSPRDLSSGQPSGKRAQPAADQKSNNQTSQPNK